MLDVFPPATYNALKNQRGQTELTRDFEPSKSLWAQGLDESKVFLAEMTHSQNSKRDFSLRFGNGGQIYSLHGPFGESVPPSWRAEDADKSPWNDEVWQFVAVCKKYNGLAKADRRGSLSKSLRQQLIDSGYADLFFIHNSGAYIPSDSGIDSLYCPLFASASGNQERSFRMLNWGLVPQVKTIHRSPLLYYTQVRDAGNGVIELTWVVHNFSVLDDVVFDHLNAPWGGTRVSSLPFRYVSGPDGSLLNREDILNDQRFVEASKTGGWNISCAAEDPDSPSLALVYGIDRHLEAEKAKQKNGQPYIQTRQSLYRDWRANRPAYKKQWKDWQTRQANSFRNYDVCEVIPKILIRPGQAIWYRSFLVVGPKERVMQQATKLVEHVDYGLLHFDAGASPKLHVSVDENSVSVIDIESSMPKRTEEDSNTKVNFLVYAKPVAGTKPLFLIQNQNTGQKVVTTDPYFFVSKEKLEIDFPAEHPLSKYYNNVVGYSLADRNSNWEALLGFVCEEKPESGNWKRLSNVLDNSFFPQSNRFHLDLWVETLE